VHLTDRIDHGRNVNAKLPEDLQRDQAVLSVRPLSQQQAQNDRTSS
jgi:hypothetical protein